MIPVVVIVGRSNVGKSTLFNRFVNRQDALVADYPGLTIDRQYGSAKFNEKSFIVIDTGGIGLEDNTLEEIISKQSTVAINEADIVLFLVDAQTGLIPLDEIIAKKLRKMNKDIRIVVNKAENIDKESYASDFEQLGFQAIHYISAAHGRGIEDLLISIMRAYPEAIPETHEDDAIKITFVGRPNVGKSTLANRFLKEERHVVCDLPGTTRDSISTVFHHHGKKYLLTDTAGVRKRGRISHKIEKFSVIKTLQSIEKSQVCLLLIDAQEGLTSQDLSLLSYIIKAGKAIIIVINKWDNLTLEEKQHIERELDRRLNFLAFAKIRFISALHGSGVGELFADINRAYKSATQILSTPKINKILEKIVAKHSPPLVNGRRIKLRYAHVGGHNPPLIIIHGNQVTAMPENYKRYLINTFIQELSLVGTPLKLEFINSENPFKDKKNKLNKRQIQKRKRLLKYVRKT